jgi:ADP-ribose pyrophosphatase YjhB (NUDIX family)
MSKHDHNFEVCVRAVVLRRGRILVCWHKINKHYFFPGGHVEYKEEAKNALLRELKEELNIKVKKASFIGVTENIYQGNEKPHHEINLVFKVVADEAKDKSRENHIDFAFFSRKGFEERKILPISLQKSVVKWLKDKEVFWASETHS